MSAQELESKLEDLFRIRVRGTLGGRVVKLIPAEKGVPDRLVLLPSGRIYLVELKTTTGTVTPKQKLWHGWAAALGTTVVVLYGRDQIEEWVRERKMELGLETK